MEQALGPQGWAAIVDAPSDAASYYTAGRELHDAGRHSDALALLRRAHWLAPHDSAVKITTADAHEFLGRYKLAERIHRALLERVPSVRPARLRLGHLLFRDGGRDAEAWREMDARTNNVTFRHSEAYPYRLWDGRPMTDKAVVLYLEGGIGDIIMFARFIPRAAARCRCAVVLTDRPIGGLVADMFADDPRVLVNPRRAPCPVGGRLLSMSLPLVLGERDGSVQSAGPYLKAAADRQSYWRQRFSDDPARRRIGIFWRTRSSRRSAPLEAFRSLSKIEGVRLYALEPNPTAEEMAELTQIGAVPVDLTADAGHFRETAAVVSVLDAVVSIDSAVAHVAGALGVPAIIALPFHGDWRWRTGDRTDWYPSARLVRQRQPGDWRRPMEDAAGFVAAMTEGA